MSRQYRIGINKGETIMQNCNIKVDEKTGIVLLAFDPSKRLGLSSTGKTVMVASTGGNVKFYTSSGEISIGLNVFVKPDDKAATKKK